MSKEKMLQEIERAQIVINQNKEKVSQGKMRQKYHFMAETGWINDPNGLIYFKGKYHFFYQYNPYQSFWENMHWGHAVSDDLIHWEYLPVALAPSEPYEDHLKGGCFSGSAIEFDGKLYLIYTAATNHGNGFVQTQCVAYSEDGIHFEKYEKNPVLTAPEGISPDSFRDPKVWKHEDSYYMVCGASKNQKGQALLYRSEDLIHWTFINVLAESRGEWGTMWECPDFFRIGNRYVLTFSPIGAGERTCVYLTGSFDYDTSKFDYDVSGEIDWGFDYYAPQSFQAPDGRRIMVAWANEWEWMPFFKDWGPTYREDWCGFFNFPREVNMTKSGRLSFVPIRELKKYRKKTGKYVQDKLVICDSQQELKSDDGIAFELKFNINLRASNAQQLLVKLRCDEINQTVCIFDLKNGELKVNRNKADGWSKGISHSILFLKEKDVLDVHILSDQSSLELFTDNYQNNHSMNVFAGNEQNKIYFQAVEGSVVLENVEVYGIEP